MTDKSLSGTSLHKYFLGKNLKKDLPASIVVFLVALPLCLGIALASGAPLFAGILTGIIGGAIVSAISGSQLSVSGPAAGLTVIVFGAIAELGSYQAFILAVVLAGVFQLIFGLLKAGTIANYFPSSVIEGMLAGIGIILILKQIPHAVGYDSDYEGDQSFFQLNSENTLSTLLEAQNMITYSALIISSLSLLILILWPKFKKFSNIPAPLVVVVLGIALAEIFKTTNFALSAKQMVEIPVVASFDEFLGLFTIPDFSRITDNRVWIVAATIAVVASLETLLCLEAVDKIDPIKRVSPTNRELIAQGVGNITSGMLGGLPMTSVIVRSSVNVNSGGRTKMSAMFHGIWLLLSLLLIPMLINKIPLSCLAAILLFTGYKLAKFGLFSRMWRKGRDQFIPFVVTVLAVCFTDLLTGVAIGMVIGVLFILRTNLRNPYFFTFENKGNNKVIRVRLAEEVSFLNKGAIQYTLTHLPKDSSVIIDGSQARYIDPDVLEIIHNFKENAHTKGILVNLEKIREKYDVPSLKELVYKPENFK